MVPCLGGHSPMGGDGRAAVAGVPVEALATPALSSLRIARPRRAASPQVPAVTDAGAPECGKELGS